MRKTEYEGEMDRVGGLLGQWLQHQSRDFWGLGKDPGLQGWKQQHHDRELTLRKRRTAVWEESNTFSGSVS